MGRAITCQELNAYRRIPVFLNVFSLLVPSLKLEKNQKQLTTNRLIVKMTLGEGEGKKAEEGSGRRNRGRGR